MEALEMEQKIIELELRVKYLKSANDLLKTELIREKESHLETMKLHLQVIATINNALPNKP